MSNSGYDEKLKEILEGNNVKDQLMDFAERLRDSGMAQIELYNIFIRPFKTMYADDPRYDYLADTLELIYGGPWAKGHGLYNSQLNEDDLA